jgi:A/G-specific adenine glycosylase
VLVSEVMLQQTQVERVIPKYTAFMERFPGPVALAAAPIPELLAAWQGLGYNRRALNLQRAAQQVVMQWDGRLPDAPAQLQQLPGIGPYTAGAIAAFAFNRPTVFLETNIRAVLLHLFCGDQHAVPDKELLSLAEQVLDHDRPRDWYNALMDYGSDLKRRFPNPSRRSRHHSVQSRFEGSDRQVRGALLRLLLDSDGLTVAAIRQALEVESDRLQRIIEGLVREGFLQRQGRRYLIPSA